MRNLLTRQLIDDIPRGKWIQLPPTRKQAQIVFEPHEDVVESLDIMLDLELREKIYRSIEEARNGPGVELSSLKDLEAL